MALRAYTRRLSKDSMRCSQRKNVGPTHACAHVYVCSLLQHIVDALSAVLGSCGRRNLRIVLDAVTTAIDTVGRQHAQQQTAAIQQLMVPLFQRWQQPALNEQVGGTVLVPFVCLVWVNGWCLSCCPLCPSWKRSPPWQWCSIISKHTQISTCPVMCNSCFCAASSALVSPFADVGALSQMPVL